MDGGESNPIRIFQIPKRNLCRAYLLNDVTSRWAELGSVWLLLKCRACRVVTSSWIRDDRDNSQVVHAKIGMPGEVFGKRGVFGVNGSACQKISALHVCRDNVQASPSCWWWSSPAASAA